MGDARVRDVIDDQSVYLDLGSVWGGARLSLRRKDA